MKRMSFLLIFASVLIASSGAIAQSPAASAAQLANAATAAPTQADQTKSANDSARLEILQAQLQTMKEYHSSLLDTVYWAMGGVFLIAGTLLGFGWFVNFKIYERDKAFLKADVETHLREQIAELEKIVDRKAIAAEVNLTEKLESLVAGHTTLLNTRISEVESAYTFQSAALERAVTALKVTVWDNEMRQKDSPTGAITVAVRLLELCAEKSPHNLDRTLAFFLDQLDKGGKLLVTEITRVTAVLAKLPPEQKAYVDRIGPKLLDAKMLY